MDPNTLSMEQGKQFLKQCGIPQRDIDLMTEKWVVLASVEVLLRFPLKPGEDPTARCVSSEKCQASVDRPPTISQRPGYQEERKSNHHLMKKTYQKLKDLPQLAAHSVHHQAQRPPRAKNPQEQQRRPMGQRTPPAEEEESRVKCKNCGAFGHSARSKTCPIKRWSGALPLQPLGSHKEKENLKPAKAQLPQAPGPFTRNDREKEQSPRPQQQQSKSPTQTFPRTPQEKTQEAWMEPAEEACSFLRHPTMPLPVHTTKKRSVLGPVSAGPPPVNIPRMRLLCPPGHNDRPRLSTCGPTKGHGGDITAALLPVLPSSRQTPTLSARPSANRPDASSHGALQPAMQAFALGPGLKSQAEMKHPNADAKPRPQQVRQKCGQDSRTQAPGKEPAPVPTQTFQNPAKKARLSSFPTPAPRTQLPDVGAVQTLQPPCIATGLRSKQAPKATTETAATKTATLQPRVNLQPPPSSPFLGPAQGCPVLQPGPPIHVPGRSGSVTFMRGDEGQKSPRFRMPPTSRPPENPASAQSPHFSREPERCRPQVSMSVLYEDLLVSSSSEDSDSD
ncbi:protein FAM90A27P [Symphalangus syndactylus]|uniref:protein FAM90A27P n=1 Tax=Symphalangus syndactylus TaxID=9590 RepID=UPI003007630A